MAVMSYSNYYNIIIIIIIIIILFRNEGLGGFYKGLSANLLK